GAVDRRAPRGRARPLQRRPPPLPAPSFQAPPGAGTGGGREAPAGDRLPTLERGSTWRGGRRFSPGRVENSGRGAGAHLRGVVGGGNRARVLAGGVTRGVAGTPVPRRGERGVVRGRVVRLRRGRDDQHDGAMS